MSIKEGTLFCQPVSTVAASEPLACCALLSGKDCFPSTVLSPHELFLEAGLSTD